MFCHTFSLGIYVNMSQKLQKKYRKYTDRELRDLLIKHARFGLEASPQQISRIFKLTRTGVYKVISRLFK